MQAQCLVTQYVLNLCLKNVWAGDFSFRAVLPCGHCFPHKTRLEPAPSILNGQKANAAWPKACILSVVSSWTAERGGHHNPGDSR